MFKNKTNTQLLSILALGWTLSFSAYGQSEQADIVYAEVDGMALALDLYMPANVTNPPLLVYVHGGAWRAGTKSSGVPTQFVEAGFAIASLDFRQSTDAPFPANVHDIKAGIRFLRANAAEYGFNASKIAIAGASSGAHLAVLVGATNNHSALEGNVGNHLNTSSDIQSILSYFAAADLTTILSQSTTFGVGVRVPALELLLGGQPEDKVELATLASPVYQVDADDPPLYLLHGDRDPQMPINQSLQMFGAYKAQGLDVTFDPVHGSAHGGPDFFNAEHLSAAIAFLNRTIGN